jgi:hypothetical protein
MTARRKNPPGSSSMDGEQVESDSFDALVDCDHGGGVEALHDLVSNSTTFGQKRACHFWSRQMRGQAQGPCALIGP